MNKSILFTCLLVLSYTINFAQSADYKIASIGFYNLENLFDTENDTLIRDEEYLPAGERSWTEERYQEKLGNMAYVISKIGTELNPKGLSILGISEIENRTVIEDLVSHDLLKDRNYGIVHYDSPDKRGIDVGLIYNQSQFTPTYSEALPFPPIDGDTIYTRDVLYVKGDLDGEEIHVMVNHWPSRSGGEARSEPRRKNSAMVVQQQVDKIMAEDINAKIFIVGDMNDNPNNTSLRSVLMAKGSKKELREGDIYNPMFNMFNKGQGSNAYRDAWSLFDQVIISKQVVDKNQSGYFHYKTEIYNPKFLVQRKGQYKGYPKRTFSGSTYQGGYSDHFPVLVYLAKKI